MTRGKAELSEANPEPFLMNFSNCLTNGFNQNVSFTYTKAHTSYTIGGERYFVVSDL